MYACRHACMYIMYEYRTYIFKCLNIGTNVIHHVIYIYTGYAYSFFSSNQSVYTGNGHTRILAYIQQIRTERGFH